MDKAALTRLRILQRQTVSVLDSLRGLSWQVEVKSGTPVFDEARVLVHQASELLKGTEFEGVCPAFAPKPHHGSGQYFAVQEIRTMMASLDGGLLGIFEQLESDDVEASSKVALLEARLAEAEVRSISIKDDELRERCIDLLLRPGKADTAVREATVLLEHRVRRAAGLDKHFYGVGLIDKALNPKTGGLEFQGTPSEREALHQLFRGAIGFFKNPTSHQIAEYDVTRARQVVGLVDVLLQLLEETRLREPLEETVDESSAT